MRRLAKQLLSRSDEDDFMGFCEVDLRSIPAAVSLRLKFVLVAALYYSIIGSLRPPSSARSFLALHSVDAGSMPPSVLLTTGVVCLNPILAFLTAEGCTSHDTSEATFKKK